MRKTAKMTQVRLSGLTAAIAVFFIAVPLVAQASCPPAPYAPGWTDTTHKAMTQRVKDAFGGDWDRYSSVWKKHQSRLETILAADGSIRMGPKGTVLKGKALKAHIGKVKRKLATVSCLARQSKGRRSTEPSIEDLTNFETAAGPVLGKSARLRSDRVFQKAATPRIRITTRCQGRDTLFRVTNSGGAWPAPATIAVYRVKDGALVSKRNLRMRGGQTMSFNVRESSKGKGLLSLRVIPSWQDGGSEQASAKCN